MPGTLFVVATPLGNLDDLSPRARRVLESVAAIACEDTRRTAKLLARFALTTPTVSCHRFNERARIEPLLRILRDGGDVALVSDGGTPGISDPGRLLIEAALEEEILVSPVPGPSAVAAILSACGLTADRFVFDGFLPHRPGARRSRLKELQGEPRTIVLFETPHRIRETLRDVDAIFGARRLVLGRELTKQHETLLRGTARQVAERLGEAPVRGEITLALSGFEAGEAQPSSHDLDAERIRGAWAGALARHSGDRRAALKEAARSLGLRRAELYRLLAELGEPDGRPRIGDP